MRGIAGAKLDVMSYVKPKAELGGRVRASADKVAAYRQASVQGARQPREGRREREHRSGWLARCASDLARSRGSARAGRGAAWPGQCPSPAHRVARPRRRPRRRGGVGADAAAAVEPSFLIDLCTQGRESSRCKRQDRRGVGERREHVGAVGGPLATSRFRGAYAGCRRRDRRGDRERGEDDGAAGAPPAAGRFFGPRGGRTDLSSTRAKNPSIV